MKRRRVVLGTVLALLGLVSVVSFIQRQTLEAELTEIAHARITEFRNEQQNEETKNTIRIGSRVAASKTFLIFGKVTGKISIFIEHQTNDGQDRFIEGLEFFYERTENGWDQTESGRCTSDLCTLEGKRLLDAIGQR